MTVFGRVEGRLVLAVSLLACPRVLFRAAWAL